MAAEGSEALELSEAIRVIREGLRRRQSPICVKIKGVTSSVMVKEALENSLRERLSSFWPREEVDRFCENLKVELHGVEKDGNWYDIFSYRWD